ncbi:metallophosphoesterase [Pseudomonas sp. LD120]|uniref:metallophosphoesterase family protein n=1 Tax=Pseudomonas sp. LD120 TaxID=485751 RepID=UPI00135B5E45|nr:metallophosphoesterase [Pseudomonas sp. LD120]KAF0867293.1 metallophosphoesterase [Pseudomonas sp. LD120]
MPLISNLEHDVDRVKTRIDGLLARLDLAWKKLRHQLEPAELQAIVQLLQRAHDQAQYALIHGDLPPGQAPVPWELAHGLSVLHLGNATPLPQTVAQLQTQVMKDGTLLGCRQWELLDLRWSEALLNWIENLRDHAPFGITPALIEMPDTVLLGMAGDWGTGYFQPNSAAQRVADLIKQDQPDFTVHLGDVYYAGTGSEENADLADWPMGRQASFSLNSNHEMYSGAHGYFAEIAALFPKQQGTSYFALFNSHWLIVGLDSAYAADEMNLYMDGNLNPPQQQWLKDLVASKGQGRKIMVLSHHQGLDISGQQQTALYKQVVAALGRVPDYWYWGHLHNGICYAPQGGMYGRCIGHGAIPYGVTRELQGNPRVQWSETLSANDPNYPLRVRNGYVRVKLDGSQISEAFVSETGALSWPV